MPKVSETHPEAGKGKGGRVSKKNSEAIVPKKKTEPKVESQQPAETLFD